MIHAILTVDDISTKNTKMIVDYLNEKKITAVMFAWGEFVENHYENAIYALQHGMIVGNHSYSHPHFSELSLEEAIEEIEKNEKILDKLYKDAGVERKYKFFRFPYGDLGGDNKDALQDYLKSHGFDKLKDTQVPYDFWKEEGLDKNIDTSWTFDFMEYCIRPNSGFTKENVFERMEDRNPEFGAALLEDGGSHILLIHDHEETEDLVPGYFKMFIDYVIDKGIIFDEPSV